MTIVVVVQFHHLKRYSFTCSFNTEVDFEDTVFKKTDKLLLSLNLIPKMERQARCGGAYLKFQYSGGRGRRTESLQPSKTTLSDSVSKNKQNKNKNEQTISSE
jgi:hypothetical protein